MTEHVSKKNTEALLASFRGLDDEFAMLKGVLCAGHALDYASPSHKKFYAVFNGNMIAARMDEINAAVIAKFKKEIEGGPEKTGV